MVCTFLLIVADKRLKLDSIFVATITIIRIKGFPLADKFVLADKSLFGR